MAFINDYLTKEETLALVAIPHYEFKWSDKYTTGRKCTIDKDKKIWFIQVPKVYGCELDRNEYVFLLYFDVICKENEIILYMNKIGRIEDSLFTQEYDKPFIYGWSIEKIKGSKTSDMAEDLLYEVLEEALDAFGINGSIDCNDSEFKNEFKAVLLK